MTYNIVIRLKRQFLFLVVLVYITLLINNNNNNNNNHINAETIIENEKEILFNNEKLIEENIQDNKDSININNDDVIMSDETILIQDNNNNNNKINNDNNNNNEQSDASITDSIIDNSSDNDNDNNNNTDDDNNNRHIPIPLNYGTEVSWPMQRHINNNNNNNNNELLTISKTQYKLYKNYMNGCYQKYNQNICNTNDNDRIIINSKQPKQQYNFTNNGYSKIRIKNNIYNILKNYYNNHVTLHSVNENWNYGNIYTNHWESSTKVLNINYLNENHIIQLQNYVQNILEKWTNVPLTLTSMYGIRIYQNNSILVPHVDRVPLVISAIINVAQDNVQDDWILELINHDGVANNITMKPGDMLLYESHSIIHGRPYPLNGTSYANIFFHYEPINYSIELNKKLNSISHNINDIYTSIINKISTKELFNNALQKFTSTSTVNNNNDRKNQKLPSHIKEYTNEASRWLQEFMFYRDTTLVDEIIDNKNKKTLSNNEKNKINGVTSAHRIAAEGNINQLKEIAILNPKLLNEPDTNGWKPIHEAARSGNIKVIEFLLNNKKYNIDINERTNKGKGGTPLWWAEKSLKPNDPVLILLKKHGAISIGPGDK